jgi:hypothetical protein
MFLCGSYLSFTFMLAFMFWPDFGEDSIRCVRILNKALILNCMVYATLCHIDSHLYQRRLCMLYSFVLTALTHHAWDCI